MHELFLFEVLFSCLQQFLPCKSVQLTGFYMMGLLVANGSSKLALFQWNEKGE